MRLQDTVCESVGTRFVVEIELVDDCGDTLGCISLTPSDFAKLADNEIAELKYR